MSVVASKKNETEFKIGHDAVKFAEHTRKICNNRKIFPPRHLDLAMNIKNMATRLVALVYEANSKSLDDPKRKEMQSSALDTCNLRMRRVAGKGESDLSPEGSSNIGLPS